MKKKPESVDDSGDKTMVLDATDTLARPGMFARLQSTLAGLLPRSRKAPDAGDDAPEAASEVPPAIKAVRLKKRLILGGAIGFLVLLLAGIGFALWKAFDSPPEQAPAEPETPHASAPTPQAEAAHAEAPQTEAPHVETPKQETDASQAEIEALKKQNAELQAQLEAMKKKEEQPRQPALTQESGESASPVVSSDGNDVTISNKDPKAAAQVLKAAIEEMNATAKRKPAK